MTDFKQGDKVFYKGKPGKVTYVYQAYPNVDRFNFKADDGAPAVKVRGWELSRVLPNAFKLGDRVTYEGQPGVISSVYYAEANLGYYGFTSDGGSERRHHGSDLVLESETLKVGDWVLSTIGTTVWVGRISGMSGEAERPYLVDVFDPHTGKVQVAQPRRASELTRLDTFYKVVDKNLSSFKDPKVKWIVGQKVVHPTQMTKPDEWAGANAYLSVATEPNRAQGVPYQYEVNRNHRLLRVGAVPSEVWTPGTNGSYKRAGLTFWGLEELDPAAIYEYRTGDVVPALGAAPATPKVGDRVKATQGENVLYGKLTDTGRVVTETKSGFTINPPKGWTLEVIEPVVPPFVVPTKKFAIVEFDTDPTHRVQAVRMNEPDWPWKRLAGSGESGNRWGDGAIAEYNNPKVIFEGIDG